MISVVLGKYFRALFMVLSSFLLVNIFSVSEFGEFIFLTVSYYFLQHFLLAHHQRYSQNIFLVTNMHLKKFIKKDLDLYACPLF